jgi:uncharacterized protein
MSDELRPDEIDPTLPETVRNFLARGAKLERIHLDDRGNWTHEGLDFDNPKIIALFNRSVGRTPGGTWILQVGTFTYPIEVEDTGFFVERLDWRTTPPTLLLSDESTEILDPATLRYAPGGRLYCTVKEGAFEARFKREPYHGLIDRLEEDQGMIYLAIGSERYPLAAAFDDEE